MYTYLAGCAEEAWLKCEKYYNLTDQSAAYYAAILLNPELKYSWFEQAWEGKESKDDWLEGVKKIVTELWEDEYKGKHNAGAIDTESTPQELPREPPRENLAALFEKIDNFKRIRITPSSSTNSTPQPQSQRDLLEDYCQTNRAKLLASSTAITFWQERYDSQRDLAHFAIDMLAIPPSSDACERLFSSAKLLLTDRRSRMKMDIIEANECLRSWFGPPKKGAFDAKEQEIMEEAQDIQFECDDNAQEMVPDEMIEEISGSESDVEDVMLSDIESASDLE